MKQIVVACGSGVATSQTVASKVNRLLKENNIPAEVLAVDIKSVDRYIAGSCAYITITKVTKEYPIPVINGIAFLTGVGQDAEFKKLGVEIYAVSTDTHFTHKAWHDSSEEIKKIQYVMVGDPTWTLSKNFEVLIESAGLADRGTFVIDPEGKIQIIEINAGGIGRDAQELLRKVKAAQYVHAHPGEVCPAKWKEGDATLAPSIDLVGKI